jgi:hypothetical protein
MITQQSPRPLCIHCNINFAKKNGVSKHGFIKYHKYCSSCCKIVYNKNRSNNCTSCDFVAIDDCQLHVVKNKTICSNCYSLYRKEQKRKSLFDITVDTDLRL